MAKRKNKPSARAKTRAGTKNTEATAAKNTKPAAKKTGAAGKTDLVDWRALLAAIIICELAGAIGSIFTMSSVAGWYAALAKPFFTPPAWVFAPVWVILYAWMGIAAYLVWQKRREKPAEVIPAFIFFVLQLIVNVKWSLLFFGLHSPFYGLIAIFVLLALIIVTAFKFYKIDALAGRLFVPYIVWVIFASLLNASIWMMNP